MTPDLRMQAGPHVFVDDLDHPTLADADRHHLERSLRLRTADPLTLSDASGGWCTAVFGDVIEPTGPRHEVQAPAYQIGLGVALTKAAKPEFAVQKATELGIDHITVFQAEHSVARWDDSKRQRNEQRLSKVAREAAMQSRRVTIPVIEVVEGLHSLLGRSGLVRADFGGTQIDSAHRFVLIGPEGGWSESERSLVPVSIDLGPHVLRAETAAVVASTVLGRSRGEVTR